MTRNINHTELMAIIMINNTLIFQITNLTNDGNIGRRNHSRHFFMRSAIKYINIIEMIYIPLIR